MNKTDGNKRMSAITTNIEQKLVAAYAVEPAAGFVSRLEKDLLAGKARARRLPVRWGARLAWAAAALIVLAAALLATPQGRALAQEIIHFFTRTESDTQPLPASTPLTWAAVTPGQPVPTLPPMAAFAADCGDYGSPRCSVEEVRSKVDFPVLELAYIPEGMHFIGATGGPDGVAIFYGKGYYHGYYTNSLFLIERPWTDSAALQRPEIGASAVVETVQIGEVSGEYVQGTFMPSLPDQDPFSTATPGGISQVWEANEGNQMLIWVDQGVLFQMQACGPAGMLDKAGFIALAAGLTTEPVSASLTAASATATPAPDITSFDGNLYDLTVAQAEALAGFDVLEPGRLPQIFFLIGASHQPEGNIVRIFYLEPTPPVMPDVFGLRLSQQVVASGADCQLCGIVVGSYHESFVAVNGMIVGANAAIETVQIGDSTGQYVEGMWGQMGAWQWLPYPGIMTLRWQANGWAFELYYGGFTINGEIPLSKADLIAIAESMK